MKSSLLIGLMISLNAHAIVPNGSIPIILKSNEKILISGNAGDIVTCGNKSFKDHTITILVSQEVDKNDCEIGPKRIYLE